MTRHALAGALVEAIMVRRLPPSPLGSLPPSLPAVTKEEEKKRGGASLFQWWWGEVGRRATFAMKPFQLSVPASWAPTALSDWAQFPPSDRVSIAISPVVRMLILTASTVFSILDFSLVYVKSCLEFSIYGPKCIDYTLEDQSDVFLATGTKISSSSSSSCTILDRDKKREAGMPLPAAAICGMVAAGYIK